MPQRKTLGLCNAKTTSSKSRRRSASYESRFNTYPGYVNGVDDRKGSASHQEVPVPWLRGRSWATWNETTFSTNGRLGQPVAPYVETFLPAPAILRWSREKRPSTSYVANAGNARADLAGCGMLHTRLPIARQSTARKWSLTRFPIIGQAGGGRRWFENADGDRKYSGDSYLECNRRSLETVRPKPNSGRRMKNPGDATPQRRSFGTIRTYATGRDVDDQRWRASAVHLPRIWATRRPSAEHRGGVNAVHLRTTHVVFLKDDIDYTVYSRLMSIRRQEVL